MPVRTVGKAAFLKVRQELDETRFELTRLDAFAANGKVTVRWTTGGERQVAGFHVLRGKTPSIADAVRANDTRIGAGRATYTYVDTDLAPGRYWYWLEEVALSGALQRYGPRSVEVSPPKLAGLLTWLTVTLTVAVSVTPPAVTV